MGSGVGTVVGGAFTGAAAMVKVNAINQQAAGDIAQAQENQRIAELAANDAVARGRREAGLNRISNEQKLSEQKVAYANSGVDPNSGTALDVQASSRLAAEADARTIENNAYREAYGHRVKAKRFKEEPQRIWARAQSETTGTVLGAIGSLAGSSSSSFSYGGSGGDSGGDAGGGGA